MKAIRIGRDLWKITQHIDGFPVTVKGTWDSCVKQLREYCL